VQYASEDHRHLLEQHGITASMSGKDDCWDNACSESFWGTLKTELVNHERYATREQAKQTWGSSTPLYQPVEKLLPILRSVAY
jgi:transposase InsO family protein